MSYAKLLSSPLDRIYLWLCTPILLALVYILPPFQAPDEPAHFFRAVQISHGSVLPVLASDSYRSGAGAAIDRAAIRLVRHHCPTLNWSCPVRDRPPPGEIVRREPGPRNEARQVTAFSNTVIYLPIAHAIPAAAIALARASGLPVPGWFYAGRIANALFALATTWLALRLLRGKAAALPLFALATLPMTLSIAPTFGADAGVIACSLLLAAVCVRLVGGDWRPWVWPALALTIPFAAAAKLAYLTLTLLPAASAVGARAPGRIVAGTLLIAAATVLATLTWSSAVHAYVFSISPFPEVDISGQVAFLRAHPIQASGILLRSMIGEAPRSAAQLVGWKLAAATVPLPLILAVPPMLTLAIAFAIGGSGEARPWLRCFALLVVLACTGSTFLFLYIQNTPVGDGRVAGYQGRYLLPILPFLPLILPRWQALDARREGLLRAFAVTVIAAVAVAVTLFLALRAWR